MWWGSGTGTVDTSILRDIPNPVGQDSELPGLAFATSPAWSWDWTMGFPSPFLSEMYLMLQYAFCKSGVVILRLTCKMANTNPLPTALPYSSWLSCFTSPADFTSFGTTEELEELSIGESKCLWEKCAGLMAGSKQKPGCKMKGL